MPVATSYTRVFDFEKLPLDLLPCILSFVTERRDRYSACLVNRVFRWIATPLLYSSVNAKVAKTGRLVHPSATLLKRPDLAEAVLSVQEDRSFFSSTDHPKALQLYVNLRAASWFDDRLHDFDATALVKFLSILKTLPHLEQLRIRSRTELPAAAWSELRQFCSLKSISIWTFDGPPVGLQGWADKMAPNLVKLELWRCAGLPPTLLLSGFMGMPHLRELGIKGVAAGFLPTLLSYLPNLIALDTDYLPSTMRTPPSQPLPSLKRLTVRLNAVRTIEWADWRFLVYLISPTDKAPSSLTEIVIDGNALHGISIGSVHSRWVFEVAERQKRLGKISLERFSVQSVEIATQELQHVFEAFPGIKELRCTLASKELKTIKEILARARHLKFLQIKFYHTMALTAEPVKPKFTIEDAREMMSGTQLRTVIVNNATYTGRWILLPNGETSLETTEELDDTHAENSKHH